MLQLKNFIKDLSDLKKPVKTILGRLSLIGIVFILDAICHTLAGLITGIGICKFIIWSQFAKTVISGPIFESIVFWGALYVFMLHKPKKMNLLWIPIFLIGIIFGLAHMMNGLSLTTAIFVKGSGGIAYGWLVVKTRSIWPNILSHMLWNFSGIIFFL